MKTLTAVLLILGFTLSSCYFVSGERIEGNGHITTENRNVSSSDKIKSAGSFDIEIVKGTTPSVKIEADENLMPYIITDNENGWLIVKPKRNYNLRPSKKIKITVTTNELNAASIAGSGDIFSSDKFNAPSSLDLGIAGSGNINLAVNTPKVHSEIAGNGNIILSGETKDAEIKIAGSGSYKASDLKAENALVNIAGSGDVTVFASTKLEIHIAGSGNVYYKGNPTLEQHIAGSGNIKQIQ